MTSMYLLNYETCCYQHLHVLHGHTNWDCLNKLNCLKEKLGPSPSYVTYLNSNRTSSSVKYIPKNLAEYLAITGALRVKQSVFI